MTTIQPINKQIEIIYDIIEETNGFVYVGPKDLQTNHKYFIIRQTKHYLIEKYNCDDLYVGTFMDILKIPKYSKSVNFINIVHPLDPSVDIKERTFLLHEYCFYEYKPKYPEFTLFVNREK
jgi:hypothetical protein